MFLKEDHLTVKLYLVIQSAVEFSTGGRQNQDSIISSVSQIGKSIQEVRTERVDLICVRICLNIYFEYVDS